VDRKKEGNKNERILEDQKINTIFKKRKGAPSGRNPILTKYKPV
jgi:hypothetical protein